MRQGKPVNGLGRTGMKGQETDTHITIDMAAEALDVSTKTIHRYLKKGAITKIKQGTRTYVPLSEVEALSAGTSKGQRRTILKEEKRPKSHEALDTVTLHRERYENLLIELGELRKQSQFLDDFRKALLAREETVRNKEREIEELKALLKKLEARELEREKEVDTRIKRIEELEDELEKLKALKPWWQK